MSVWGKMLGGATGLALGGPLGALIGAAAGHAVDKVPLPIGARQGNRTGDNTQKVAFTIAVIALSAKMAKADGVVSQDEEAVFQRLFRVPAGEARNVRRVFNIAKRDVRGYEAYAQQIASMFQDRPAVLEDLLDGLFQIAQADGIVTPDERRFLAHVAAIFGFDRATYERIEATHLGNAETGDAPDGDNPYAVLGVSPKASDRDIKIAYHNLLREHHPDRLSGQGLPQEFIDVANRKVATINAAYDQIQRQRRPH